jgi:hypothetical protein
VPTFQLTMLPALDGDCLILTWGDGGKCSHAVIDGGRAAAYPHLHRHLVKMAEAGETLELYVLTHIDADHIAGALTYLKSRTRPIEPKQVWYNGFRQVRPGDRRSMRQGDEYSEALEKLRWPLNTGFERGVVSIETAPAELDVAGLKITLLSPDAAHLEVLGERWDEWRREQEESDQREGREDTRGAGKSERPPVPDPFVIEDLIADGETDHGLPNGSSIAFVAEWGGARMLLAGDAHPDLIAASLASMAEREGGRYHLDLLKASHHGSAKNTTREMIEILDCRRMAISTNGNLHGHPDPQAIARFLHFGTVGHKHLHFNYATDRALAWDAETVKERHDYETHLPPVTEGELVIDLL